MNLKVSEECYWKRSHLWR